MQNYLFERAEALKSAKKKRKKGRGRRLLIFSLLFIPTVLVTAFFLLMQPWLYLDFEFGTGDSASGSTQTTPPSSFLLSELSTETTIPRADPNPEKKLTVTQTKGTILTTNAIYEKMLPSVVSVHAYFGQYYSAASGVVLSADGYIVTNYHIIEGASSAEVALPSDGRIFPAKVVGWDADLDLAVLKVEADDLVPAEYYDSYLLNVGEPAYALGNALGYLEGTFTEGIVSAPVRSTVLSGLVTNAIQTTAPLNHGNSGGALINAAGQVIGITTSKMIGTKSDLSIEGLGFAIPISDALGPINSILAHGRVITPRIGISCYDVILDDTCGLFVNEVIAGEPAEQAGLRPQDIIIAANGRPFVGVNGLKSIFCEVGVGGSVILTVIRGAQELELTVTLIE